MKAGALIVAFSLVLSAASTAMEPDEAKAFLQGTWSANSETWIFTDDRWQQFIGGVSTDTTYTVEAMPAEMFVVISGETGRRYVVHATPQFGSMTWFVEGETQQIGFYSRQKAQ